MVGSVLRPGRPLYERIVDDLKSKIAHGELRPGDQLYTIAQICRAYEVSRITADRVVTELKHQDLVETFRGRGAFVKGLPRVEPADVVPEEVNAILLLWAGGPDGWFRTGFAPGIWKAIADEAHRRRIPITLQYLATNLTDIPPAPFVPRAGQGIIILGGLLSVLEYAILISPRVRSVLVDAATMGAECVLTDNQEGMRQTVEHLVGLGHRRMAYVTGFRTPNALNENERQESFRRLCADRKMPVTVFDGGVFEELLNAQESPGRPTAYVFSREEPAMEFLCLARDRGWRVPEHFSIVGYDDHMPEGEEAGLTCVRVDREAMGRAAVEHLLTQRRRRPRVLQWKRIAPTLMARRTTGPASAGRKSGERGKGPVLLAPGGFPGKERESHET